MSILKRFYMNSDSSFLKSALSSLVGSVTERLGVTIFCWFYGPIACTAMR